MENRTYRYFKGEALYPFGFGLGFEPFEISEAAFNDGTVTAVVKNNGKTRASEVVQVYIEIEGEKETHSLCGLQKVTLDAGQRSEISVFIPEAAFMRYDGNGDLQPCKGEKILHVGFCQPDARSIRLKGNVPVKIIVYGG
jgi:beta-glucosidase